MVKRRLPGAPKFVSTCATYFGERGDEWYSGRDSEKEYPVLPEENPDMDRFTQATRARRKAKGKQVIVPLDKRPFEADPSTKRVNIVLAMRRKIRRYGVE